MCLLVLFYKTIPGYPLVLCANRDEYLNRPAEAPSLKDGGEGCSRFLAPRDLRAAGTWIGLNQHLGVAAITNRKGMPFREDAPSRGQLCLHALAQGDGTVRGMVRETLERAGRDVHNGFNLLLADRESAYLVSGGGRGVRCVGIPPGIHVLTNEHELNALTVPGASALADGIVDGEDLLDKGKKLLQSHDPLDASGFTPCKHEENRGTRSATLISMDEGTGVRFLFADGPPCTTAFADLSDPVQALRD